MFEFLFLFVLSCIGTEGVKSFIRESIQVKGLLSRDCDFRAFFRISLKHMRQEYDFRREGNTSFQVVEVQREVWVAIREDKPHKLMYHVTKRPI